MNKKFFTFFLQEENILIALPVSDVYKVLDFHSEEIIPNYNKNQKILGSIYHREELISILNIQQFLLLKNYEIKYIVLFFYCNKNYAFYINNPFDILEIEENTIIKELPLLSSDTVVGAFQYDKKIAYILNSEMFVWKNIQN